MTPTTRKVCWWAAYLVASGVLLWAVLQMAACSSTVKVDPAKSEATRTVDGGSTTLTVDVWPKGKGPTQ